MKHTIKTLLFATVIAVIALVSRPGEAGAVCCPIPPPDWEIQNAGQLNLVRIDKKNEMIQLIPNIRFTGNARDFALIVPTPAEPALFPASATIWREARNMTAPIFVQRSNDDGAFGCNSSDFATGVLNDGTAGGGDAETRDDGVIVISETTVGAFQATVITSDDPDALVNWLNERNFTLAEEDEAKFAPLVEDGWFFTAMRLDTTKAQVPAQGWNTNVDPVLFEFAGTDFEFALPILSINWTGTLPVTFYVVGDDRASLDGFRTRYANRITASEYEAMLTLYPSMADFAKAGTFLTRLERTITTITAFRHSIYIEKAATNDEFRETTTQQQFFFRGAGPAQLLVLLIPAGAWWRARRPVRKGSPERIA
ncbi:MAG: DUF2330 domain-containing protein [Gemmatimonadetes bacterium]|nr:DUF2330 domain-containing protein [Gemmatimonadota bacterium]